MILSNNPTAAAYKYLTSVWTAKNAHHRAPKVDNRTKFGKAVMAEYNRLKNTVNYTEISKKQAVRREAKKECGNILSNPLVIDYIKNKGRFGFRVTADRIIDGGRNHWAKSDRDRKILAILSK